jgi:AsmA-like C-terminal region
LTNRKRNWLLAAGLAALAVATGLVLAAASLRSRIDPYARQQVVQYLTRRFNSDVELRQLHIGIPQASLLRLLVTRGRGALVSIEGEGLTLRSKLGQAEAPLFSIKEFTAEVPLDSLFQPHKLVTHVSLEGMDIRIPPPGERPKFSGIGQPGAQSQNTGVLIEEVNIRNASLTMLPKDPRKVPLRFDIHQARLQSVGPGVGMKYEASLTNAKPPGNIQSTGTFGPWAANEPGATPLTGDYTFDNADLGVFNGIAGTLHSTGRFEGKLSAIHASGDAFVPNFRMKMAENAVPLSVRFSVLVDGGNGNTILNPVVARLGSTSFTTSGGIIRHEAGLPRAISLDVAMPNGDLRDVLRLAMRGEPIMEGRLALKTKIDIPPLTGKVREKLKLNGHFEITNGKLLRSNIQNHIDGFSRRAQGQPQNHEIDQVVSQMNGVFQLDNAVIHFNQLSFGIPGAKLDMAGDYGLDTDAVAMTGSVKLQATVSQMVTGWKRWALKPVDKFFEKDGAGTFLHFHVGGTSKKPQFGLDLRGH